MLSYKKEALQNWQVYAIYALQDQYLPVKVRYTTIGKMVEIRAKRFIFGSLFVKLVKIAPSIGNNKILVISM